MNEGRRGNPPAFLLRALPGRSWHPRAPPGGLARMDGYQNGQSAGPLLARARRARRLDLALRDLRIETCHAA